MSYKKLKKHLEKKIKKTYNNICKSFSHILKKHIHRPIKKHTKHINTHVKKHAAKHLPHAHKILYHHHLHHHLMHTGELAIVSILGLMSLIFAGTGVDLPNNTTLSYPLAQVSTLECRILEWESMPENCKINLPIITDANYKKYEQEKIYRDIYTVLWAAPYTETWNQKIGAHGAIDIATAKGTPLYSLGEGKVYFAGYQAGYGNVVKVQYVYNGETIYVMYEHMDTIEIKKGDMIKRGQRIGTVGNTGNTFGGLGGYHLHLEINKEKQGRAAYIYEGCEDREKGKSHYEIIQNGLCRLQVFANSYDPIKLLEEANAQLPSHASARNNDDVVIVDNGNSTNSTDGQIGSGEQIDEQPIVVNTIHEITLDFSNIDDPIAQHFLSQWDLMVEDIEKNSLQAGEETQVTLKITNKKTNEKFTGVLPITINAITTNTNIQTSPSRVQFVRNGEIPITVKSNKIGESSVILNVGTTKIGKVALEVK